ncbi:MAG: Rab family GTPase [Candidatus Heimdallarchaeaceae archaeon]
METKIRTIKKIVLIGDARVGKTSLVRRYVTGMFNPAYQITLGTTIMKKEVEYIDHLVIVSIWDVGGQEVFREIRSKYYYGSSGALAVCDASKYETYENLAKWVKSFYEIVGEKPIIFIANKIDLPELEVTEEDMKKLTKKFKHSRYLMTSAKENVGVEQAFYDIVRLMMEKEDVI